jgi:hypothetical protein
MRQGTTSVVPQVAYSGSALAAGKFQATENKTTQGLKPNTSLLLFRRD